MRDMLVVKYPWKEVDCARTDCLVCHSVWAQPDTTPKEYKAKLGSCFQRGTCYKITCVACLRRELRAEYVGETGRSTYERMQEHLQSLRRGARATRGCKGQEDQDLGPLEKHHQLYHPGEQPEYWAKVLSSHQTAFQRQVTEGVKIGEISRNNDITMNSKGEVLGNRLTRVVLDKGGPKERSVMVGDLGKLDSKERKLLEEIEDDSYDTSKLWEG